VTKNRHNSPIKLPEIRKGQELSCNSASEFRKRIQEQSETATLLGSKQLLQRSKLTQRQRLHHEMGKDKVVKIKPW
jgi:hypothetical protein